jgi:hypothetical protein
VGGPGIWLESGQRQPLRNNPKKAATGPVMSDYIMSVTGGASASGPLADGNAMLCKIDHLKQSKLRDHNDQQEQIRRGTG